MENLNDPEVQAWMKAQNNYARAALDEIPGRQQLLARVRQLDSSVPQVQAWRLPGGKFLVKKYRLTRRRRNVIYATAWMDETGCY
jgi:prolyl oligopeptidase